MCSRSPPSTPAPTSSTPPRCLAPAPPASTSSPQTPTTLHGSRPMERPPESSLLASTSFPVPSTSLSLINSYCHDCFDSLFIHHHHHHHKTKYSELVDFDFDFLIFLVNFDEINFLIDQILA